MLSGRQDGYWDPEAQQAARIELVSVTDPNARLSALLSDQIDVALIKADQTAQVERTGQHRIRGYPPGSAYALYLDTGRSAPADARARQALNFAVDREAIHKALFDEACTPSGQPLGRGSAVSGTSEKVVRLDRMAFCYFNQQVDL